MKETFYFAHDYNARNDPKLQNVLFDLGVEGIGVFWCIIEQLYEQGGKLPLHYCKSIAFALHVDFKCVERLVNDYGLFKNDGENIWSESVLNRLNRRSEVSEKRKLAALARWRQGIENQSQTQVPASCMQVKDNASDMQMQCKTDANAEHKVKEIKEKNNIKESIKENKIKENINSISNDIDGKKAKTARRFIPPTVEEVKARIDEMGYTFDAEAFIAFYQSNGWMVGKSKMKDWRAAMVTWQKREPRFPRGGKSSSTSKKANEEW